MKTNRRYSLPVSNKVRADQLTRLFKRSASFRYVAASGDGKGVSPLLRQSLFFSCVGRHEYYVETHLGSGGDKNALALFVVAAPTPHLPNIMIQFSSDGTLQGMVEAMLKPTDVPGEFNPVQAVPIFPTGRKKKDALAEEIADRVLADLAERGEERSLEDKPLFLRQLPPL